MKMVLSFLLFNFANEKRDGYFIKNIDRYMENVLDKELYKYFLQLNDNQKNSLLNMIKSFMQSNVKETDITTIAEYNDDLDKSMSRISKGDFTTLENLEVEMHQW